MGESGGHAGDRPDNRLKPVVPCRPVRPRISTALVVRVRETAQLFGCSELEAAYVTVQLLHDALAVHGLASSQLGPMGGEE